MKFINGMIRFFRELISDTLKTAFVLFKIMIPISIVVKILQETGAISYIGIALFPLMKYVGLPGEMGLVWATGMITNLYGGILAFISISAPIHLSIAQVSVLSLMMLTAHTFPIELRIANKSGVRLFVMFIIRFGFAFISGIILNIIYTSLNILQEPSTIMLKPSINQNPTIFEWALSEIQNYGVILCFIFTLMFLLKLLKKIGFIDVITRWFAPVLNILGIGKEVTTIAIVGLTLGVVYGGALIINESQTKKINKLDIFYSMTLMGLCHSVIEDTLLMISLGAHYSGVLVFRVVFALLLTYVIVQTTKHLPDSFIRKWIITK